jgi:hypothetical protein
MVGDERTAFSLQGEKIAMKGHVMNSQSVLACGALRCRA